jgi:prevent-host-death family protein
MTKFFALCFSIQHLVELSHNRPKIIDLQMPRIYCFTNIIIMIIYYQNYDKGGSMPLIRPISDLRNRAVEISELCHSEDQPVFITRNGKGDLVVMSQAHYERLQSLIELYQKLGEAEALETSGQRGITHAKLMEKLREKIS